MYTMPLCMYVCMCTYAPALVYISLCVGIYILVQYVVTDHVCILLSSVNIVDVNYSVVIK